MPEKSCSAAVNVSYSIQMIKMELDFDTVTEIIVIVALLRITGGYCYCNSLPDKCLAILINQLPAQLTSNNNNDYFNTCSSLEQKLNNLFESEGLKEIIN